MNSVPPFPTPSASVTSNADSDFDECEVLLKRAIEMVRGPVRRSRSTDGSAETQARLVSSVLVHQAPPNSVSALAEADGNVNECEVLLRRAIEMVRGSVRGSRATRSLADSSAETPATLVSFTLVHPAPSNCVLASADTDIDVDECEALLRHAIEIVRGSR